MPEVGDATIPRLVVTPYDGTTMAALTVTSGREVTTSAPASVDSADPVTGQVWLAVTAVEFTSPGLWIFQWTVTGQGHGRESVKVQVTPDPLVTRRMWATTADLADWIDAPPPLDARRMLAHATREIEDLIKFARYDVDTAGEPTDVEVKAALRDAVCEQVQWWIKSGDEHGARALYTTVSIGSVSVARGGRAAAGNSSGGAQIPPIGRSVYPILRRAGLLDFQPNQW